MKSVWSGIGLMVLLSLIAWAVTGTQVQTTGESLTAGNNAVRLDN